jgi:hypothetical protein
MGLGTAKNMVNGTIYQGSINREGDKSQSDCRKGTRMKLLAATIFGGTPFLGTSVAIAYNLNNRHESLFN